MVSQLPVDVAVIGAGIIGVNAALYLQRQGRKVTVFERAEVAAGASAGNAGFLAFPEIIPIPSPGIIWKAPKWLMDPLGPLSIPPAYALPILPWLYRFWRASSAENFARGIAIQADLMSMASSEMADLRREPSLASFFAETGTLDLYDTEASLLASQGDWARKKEAGHAFRRVGRDEIDELQPGLAPQFRHAIFSTLGIQIGEPRDYTRAVAQLAIESGAEFATGEAIAIRLEDSKPTIQLGDGRTVSARTIVVAAGAWSKMLARSLGDTLPLDTERGYNTTLPLQDLSIRRQLYFNDHGFVVAPLQNGIRIGGAVELGGLALPPNWRRQEALLAKAARFLPKLDTSGGRRWMGFRPSMPDCLPVIGRARATPDVIYAFGHGHLGLTQSAATGRLIADLAGGKPLPASLSGLAPDRFL